MNKQDYAIVGLLVILLIGWIWFQNKQTAERRAAYLAQMEAEATNAVPPSALSDQALQTASLSSAAAAPTNAPAAANTPETATAGDSAPASAPEAAAESEPASDQPERTTTLTNASIRLTVSSKGAAIADATLFGYRQTIAKDSGDMRIDFANGRALALRGIPGFGANADFDIVSQSETSAVLRATAPSGLALTRTISLAGGYRVSVSDHFENTSAAVAILPTNAIALGTLDRIEHTRNGVLSIDHLPVNPDGRPAAVNHFERKGQLAKMFGGGGGGGCMGGGSAEGLAPSASLHLYAPQAWLALKSRFFCEILSSSTPNKGADIGVARSLDPGPLKIASVSGALLFDPSTLEAGASADRAYSLYIGPKKHSVVCRFAPRAGQIMDFGFWGWFCVGLLYILNAIHAVVRNYGVAIILLTILVRVVFWPLTRKSNEGMKRMQVVQPQIKAAQEKFKDDPQKLQQETMRIYRENHVNPMTSCLPMLIQLPFFIALFVVLRSAVELRFAPFLWIADLSEPENLLEGMVPFVRSLNILPLLMALTMFLQSKLTPSMGDAQQQRMMAWMMPLMMLFMFYTQPAGLLLYWTVSQGLAIVQLWRQRRKGAALAAAADGAEVVEPEHMTRQQRRALERAQGDK